MSAVALQQPAVPCPAREARQLAAHLYEAGSPDTSCATTERSQPALLVLPCMQ
jgi:hypothetical protein